jgi:hypothetical protein
MRTDLEAVVRRRAAADILHTDPRSFPVVRRQQHFLVVAAGLARRLDDQKTVHPGIEASPEIRSRHVVAVIPARPGGLRAECVALRSTALHHRRSFFHRTVRRRRYVKPVPVDDVINVRIVVDVDADLAAFTQAQYGAGHRTVVSKRVDYLSRRELDP